jgi:enamine deaminase RidA (YjgF/YER057c/UK114 family)
MTYPAQRDLNKGNGSACRVRRFAGPEADELFVLCRPETAAGDSIVGQTESVCRMLHDVLRAHSGDIRHVVHEMIFFRDIGQDLAAFRRTQDALLQELSCDACRPASTFIEQPPLDECGRLGLSAFAVIPRCRGVTFGRTLWTVAPCACAAPWRFATRVVRVGAQEYLYAGSVYGSDGSAFDEAFSMFSAAEQVLRREGLTFQQVVRTWIHLRDIDRDYAEFNRARREFFRRAGVTVHPASTGIEGAPFLPGHNLSMSLYAIKSPAPLEVGVMTTPTLNEAWMYGSDFSRGLKVVEANKVALYVSGTASVDEQGRTAHAGDLAGQVDRMLTNILTLLSAQNASFSDVVTAITYLKSPEDAPGWREIFRARGLASLPNALVKAAPCRSDLLCEMEAIAALPRPERSDS